MPTFLTLHPRYAAGLTAAALLGAACAACLPSRDSAPARVAIELRPDTTLEAAAAGRALQSRAVAQAESMRAEGEAALRAWSAHVQAVDAWWDRARAALPRTRTPDARTLQAALEALAPLQAQHHAWTLRCPAPLNAPIPEMPALDAPEDAWAAFIDAVLRRELRPTATPDASEAIAWGTHFLADAERVLEAAAGTFDPTRLDWAWQALHDRFNAWSAALDAVPEAARRPLAWRGTDCPGANG